jgi:hypothetical protein
MDPINLFYYNSFKNTHRKYRLYNPRKYEREPSSISPSESSFACKLGHGVECEDDTKNPSVLLLRGYANRWQEKRQNSEDKITKLFILPTRMLRIADWGKIRWFFLFPISSFWNRKWTF